MGKRTRLTPPVMEPRHHPAGQDPTVSMTRDQFQDLDDPNRVARHEPDDTICSLCEGVVHNQHWVQDPSRHNVLRLTGIANEVVCPGCRRAQERLPRGILTVRGSYWAAHRSEILHLIRNESEEAVAKNPLARVLSSREEDGCLIVETSNEKLAQRLGTSLRKAHDGEVTYDWPERNHLLRVEWTRDVPKGSSGQ